MVAEHLPPIGAALGFLAVLAAVMSTLDAQLLTLGSMLTPNDDSELYISPSEAFLPPTVSRSLRLISENRLI